MRKKPTNLSLFHVQCKNFPDGSMVKNLPANAGDLDSIPGSGRSPGEGNGKPLQYSCWRIPWTKEPGGLQSVGSQRVRHNDETTCHFNTMVTFQINF